MLIVDKLVKGGKSERNSVCDKYRKVGAKKSRQNLLPKGWELFRFPQRI